MTLSVTAFIQLVKVSHLLFMKHIFFIKIIAIIERLARRAALTALPLVRTLVVVAIHVLVEIGLHFIQRAIDFLSKSDLVELILDYLVQALNAPIGLRVTSFGSRVLNGAKV